MKKHDGCKGCRYIRKSWWEHPCRSCKGMEDIIKKDYWAPCENKWVKSNTRLPEIGEGVLCITTDEYYTVGVLHKEGWDLDCSCREREPLETVRYWMPLPELPEEAKE